MQNYWFENLPPSCPPADSEKCNGAYYRVSVGNPAQSEDFFSQRKIAPDKIFKGEDIDECIVRSVSLFSDLNDAKRLLKLPKFKKANIAKVCLTEKDGNIKKTFGHSHFSWWRSISFDVSQAKIIKV